MGPETVSEALEGLRRALKNELPEDSIEYAICLTRANEIGQIKLQYENQPLAQPAFFGHGQ